MPVGNARPQDEHTWQATDHKSLHPTPTPTHPFYVFIPQSLWTLPANIPQQVSRFGVGLVGGVNIWNYISILNTFFINIVFPGTDPGIRKGGGGSKGSDEVERLPRKGMIPLLNPPLDSMSIVTVQDADTIAYRSQILQIMLKGCPQISVSTNCNFVYITACFRLVDYTRLVSHDL